MQGFESLLRAATPGGDRCAVSGYGDGEIRRRGKRWQIDAYVGPTRIRRGARTEKEAKEILAELRLERARLDAGRAPRLHVAPTYDDAFDGLEVAWVARGLRSRTLATYRQEVAWLRPWWGVRRITDTTPGLIATYVAACRAEGLSTSQIRHRLDRISQAHRYAADEQWIAHEPCRVKRPAKTEAEEGRRRQPAPDDEFAAVLAKADARETLAGLLARDAGLRRAEIARVEGEDVSAAWIVLRVTKGRRGRSVPVLTKRLRAALAAAPKTGPLVTGVTSAEGVDKLWRRARERAGVSGCTLHQLRHAWMTELESAGVDEARRMKWAGHVDAETSALYSHGSPQPEPGTGRKLDQSRTGHRTQGAKP